MASDLEEEMVRWMRDDCKTITDPITSQEQPQNVAPTIRPAYRANVDNRTVGYPRHSFATAG